MLSKLLRLGEGRMVKRLKGVADYVGTLADDVEKLTDAELRAKTDEFKKRHADGVARRPAARNLRGVPRGGLAGLGPTAVRRAVMGAAALHFGNVAEMKTGEGKTLASVLPAYLNGIGGKGVHIVTVNGRLLPQLFEAD